ncbi:hypothetical protein SAMN02745866_04275 [Alteromonadaceae bacterium Bs31]|nr:hypothetical protein SAMN02745866_04259 [Alteromonadaceae bacterium Bs31]SMF66832.1 hypothetical protein SAMN02745866_04275 [Alteromonadaceae bacterium Bs31]
MTQDLGVPLYEGFEEIYYDKTPEEIVYPGSIVVRWREFELSLREYISSSIKLVKLDLYERVCFVSYGCIAYPRNLVELNFRVFGVTKSGAIPCDEPFERISKGYTEISNSSSWGEWEAFVANLNSIVRLTTEQESNWEDKLEEQYNICTLRVLREVLGLRKQAAYSGFYGETAAEWANRSSHLHV